MAFRVEIVITKHTRPYPRLKSTNCRMAVMTRSGGLNWFMMVESLTGYTMSILALPRIIDAVTNHEPATYESHAKTRHAAVAIVIRETAHATEALFILRATKDGDPWSGHMAFPGGHCEKYDDSIEATAARETLEEVGLDLATYGEFVGQIDAVRANPRGRDLDMVVTPCVFLLKKEPPPMNPNYEVADILWGKLDHMYTGESLTTGEFMIQGEKHRYPGYDVSGQVVWGLTHRMLDQFFGMIDPEWEPHDT